MKASNFIVGIEGLDTKNLFANVFFSPYLIVILNVAMCLEVLTEMVIGADIVDDHDIHGYCFRCHGDCRLMAAPDS